MMREGISITNLRLTITIDNKIENTLWEIQYYTW